MSFYSICAFREDYSAIASVNAPQGFEVEIEALLDSLKFREIPPQDYIRGVLYREEIKSFQKLFFSKADNAYVDYIRRRKARIEIAETKADELSIKRYLLISKQQIQGLMKRLKMKNFSDFLFYKIEKDSNPLSIKLIDLGLILPGILVYYYAEYQELNERYGTFASMPTMSYLYELKERIYTDQFYKENFK